MQIRMRGASGTRTLPLMATLVLALLIAGCAGSASAPQDLAPVGNGAARPVPAASGGPDAPRDEESGGGQGVPTGEEAAFRDDAKIVRTGSLQLEVSDVAAALRTAREAILAMGGYIGASQQYNDGEQTVATVTYRIPADQWEQALDRLRGLGELIGEQTDAAEVTDQIVDLDARIRNLKASETALVKHAANAARIADLLEIESRLSDVRGQIEQLTAQKANLEERAAFATLAVTFGVEVEAITLAAERWDPLTEAERATASLVGLLQAVTTAAIWFGIVILPIGLVLLAVAGIVLFVRRRARQAATPTGAGA